MKLSNLVLSIVACAAFGAAVAATSMVMPTSPTSVLYIQKEDGNSAGMAVKMPSRVTHKQAELLTMAYDIAKKDGHKQPQLLQGIILQESLAGEAKSYKVAGQEFGLKTNLRYYGIAQIKLAAAQDVLNAYPNVKRDFDMKTNTDEEIIAKLIENDKFNLSIASKYLLILKKYGYNTIDQLALAYNQGAGGAKDKDPTTHHYSRGVINHISQIQHRN